MGFSRQEDWNPWDSPGKETGVHGTLQARRLESMGLSRQGDWSGLPCPSPGDLPNLRITPTSPVSPAFRWVLDRLRHQGRLIYYLSIACHLFQLYIICPLSLIYQPATSEPTHPVRPISTSLFPRRAEAGGGGQNVQRFLRSLLQISFPGLSIYTFILM